MNEPTRLRDIKVSARDQLMIDPRDIAIEKGHNPRDYRLKQNREHLDEIKESIRQGGTIQPLLVRWDAASKQCVLVAGECRLRANLELIEEGLDIKSVPTVQVSGNNEIERLVTALIENTGKPLSKWENGGAFKRLIGFGWTIEQVVKRLGYTPRYVKEAIELADAPEDVKALLSEEAVTPSLALQHIRRDGTGAGAALTEKVSRARSKSPGKEKVTAKRERKPSTVNLTKAEANKIKKALRHGLDFEDSYVTKKACEEALAIFDSK